MHNSVLEGNLNFEMCEPGVTPEGPDVATVVPVLPIYKASR